MKMQESDWSGKLKQTTVLPAHEDTVRVRGHVRGVCDLHALHELKTRQRTYLLSFATDREAFDNPVRLFRTQFSPTRTLN